MNRWVAGVIAIVGCGMAYCVGFAEEALQLAGEVHIDHTPDGVNYLDYRKHYVTRVRQMLIEKQFAELETEGKELRTKRIRFQGGNWKLNYFYEGLETPSAGINSTESQWKVHFSQLKAWSKEMPDSGTAQIGLGSAYLKYAWKQRTARWAKDVSQARMKAFGVNLKASVKYLTRAQELLPECPYLYDAYARLYLGAGIDEGQRIELLKKAAKLERGYYSHYYSVVQYFLERWYGQTPTTWIELLNEIYPSMGEEKDLSYARTIWSVENYVEKIKFSSQRNDRVDWEKVNAGFKLMQKRYGPLPINSLNKWCVWACLNSDYETAAPLFRLIGDDMDKEIWPTTSYFTQTRELALKKYPESSQIDAE